MSENRCVCCGQIIPEGEQVCIACRNEAMSYERNVDKSRKRRRFVHDLFEDWIVPLGLGGAVILAVYLLMGYGWW